MRTLCIAHAWLEAAQRCDERGDGFLCNIVKKMQYAGEITVATRNAMLERIRVDLSARFNREVDADEVAYHSAFLSYIDGGNEDDDMKCQDECEARVLAALMFAHEALG